MEISEESVGIVGWNFLRTDENMYLCFSAVLYLPGTFVISVGACAERLWILPCLQLCIISSVVALHFIHI